MVPASHTVCRLRTHAAVYCAHATRVRTRAPTATLDAVLNTRALPHQASWFIASWRTRVTTLNTYRACLPQSPARHAAHIARAHLRWTARRHQNSFQSVARALRFARASSRVFAIMVRVARCGAGAHAAPRRTYLRASHAKRRHSFNISSLRALNRISFRTSRMVLHGTRSVVVCISTSWVAHRTVVHVLSVLRVSNNVAFASFRTRIASRSLPCLCRVLRFCAHRSSTHRAHDSSFCAHIAL